MAIYRMAYHSMNASYGPSYIEAGSEEEARRKWGAFSGSERLLITARKVSSKDLLAALRKAED